MKNGKKILSGFQIQIGMKSQNDTGNFNIFSFKPSPEFMLKIYINILKFK